MDRMERTLLPSGGVAAAADGSTRLRCMRPHGLPGRMAVVEYLRCDEGIKALDAAAFPGGGAPLLDSQAGARCARRLPQGAAGAHDLEEVLRVAADGALSIRGFDPSGGRVSGIVDAERMDLARDDLPGRGSW